jgi:hypothetical protein
VDDTPNIRRGGWGDEEYRSEGDFGSFWVGNTVGARRRRQNQQNASSKKSKTKGDTGKGKQYDTLQTTDECCCNEDDEEPLPSARAPAIKEEDASEKDSRQTQEPTPPPEERQLRGADAGFLGVSPEPLIRAVERVETGNEQAQVMGERAYQIEEQVDDGNMDLDEDFDYQMRLAEIERNRAMQEAAAEAAYQQQIARIQAQQRARGRRNQV